MERTDRRGHYDGYVPVRESTYVRFSRQAITLALFTAMLVACQGKKSDPIGREGILLPTPEHATAVKIVHLEATVTPIATNTEIPPTRVPKKHPPAPPAHDQQLRTQIESVLPELAQWSVPPEIAYFALGVVSLETSILPEAQTPDDHLSCSAAHKGRGEFLSVAHCTIQVLSDEEAFSLFINGAFLAKIWVGNSNGQMAEATPLRARTEVDIAYVLAPDYDSSLPEIPDASVSDLHIGDIVYLVSRQESASSNVEFRGIVVNITDTEVILATGIDQRVINTTEGGASGGVGLIRTGQIGVTTGRRDTFDEEYQKWKRDHVGDAPDYQFTVLTRIDVARQVRNQ